MGWTELLQGLVKEGVSSNHRRLVVFVGTDEERLAKYAADALMVFSSIVKEPHGLYMYQPEYQMHKGGWVSLRNSLRVSPQVLTIGLIKIRISSSALP